MPALPSLRRAVRRPAPLSAFAAIVAVLAAVLSVAGCGGTEPGPGKTLDISASMRSSCPAHPFKPEFQGASALVAGVAAPGADASAFRTDAAAAAGKSAAVSVAGAGAAYPYQVEIYDNAGDLVVEWSGVLDPQNQGSMQGMVWAGTDSRGRPVPSGYYFVRIRLEDGSGQTQTRTTCTFYVNPDDSGKLK